MPRTWPLVGRDEDLRVAGRALGPRGDRSGVVLSGPAGVGKTRLARELVARLTRDGREAHWALATDSASEVPLAVFGGLLDAPSTLTPDSLTRAVEALARGSDGRPAVVGIDDAHLLDDLSAVLVHRLVTRQVAPVVLTVRDGQAAPDAITALWADEHLPRLAVEPLSQSATRELLERVLEGPLEGATAGRLWSLTRGNALFLRHLVDGELRAGRLSLVNDVWCWRDAPEITGELAEIVRRQMGDLRHDVVDTIDVLALAEPLTLATVCSLTGDDALEAAEARGLVEVEQEPGRLQVRLAHPMYGEVRRADLGTVRSRRLRGLIASTLLASGEVDDEPVRRAVLVLDSDLPPDPDLFLESAEHALAHLDIPLGERLARAAVDTSGSFESRITLAYALLYIPRPEEAERLLAELDAEASDPAEVMQVTLMRVGNLYWTLHQPDRAQAVLAEGLARASSRPTRVPLLGLKVGVDAAVGRVGTALEDGMRLLGDDAHTDVSAVMVATGVALSAGVQGRLDLLTPAVRAGHEAGRGSPTSIGPHFTLGDWGVLALRLAGRIADATKVAATISLNVSEVPGPAHAMGRLIAGHAALGGGRLRTAIRDLSEARIQLQAGNPFIGRSHLLLTQAAAMSGDGPMALRLLAELCSLEVELYVPTRPEHVLARAWVAAAEGATTEAVRVAREAAAVARDMEEPAYEVLAWQTATQFGDPSGVDRLAGLAGLVQGPRAAAALAHGRALADHDGDALAAVSVQWEQIGDLLAAADAAAQAAVGYQRDRRNGSALAASNRAHHLAGVRCEGADTPAIRAAARPLPITDREREIATLAAQGLTNREIANRLTVSIRTIEGHLYRAGNKLGVHERAELAALLAIE